MEPQLTNTIEKIKSNLWKLKQLTFQLNTHKRYVKNIEREGIMCVTIPHKLKLLVETKFWPTRKKNQIIALIYITRVTKKELKIHILSDNIHFCDTATKLFQSLPHMQSLAGSTNNWSSWLFWLTLTTFKNQIYTFEYKKQTSDPPNVPVYILSLEIDHNSIRYNTY
ncbi:37341_t:CDS:1 [Gigaspora margarita]|uniref:37341_t:CDS:1 n=1 Tax=Gigaspora margarita TaxID=4874 RepID=A0ABN7UFK6_GIGMA|nr:37341_t:CDS:1 [Gigaspora margarita]